MLLLHLSDTELVFFPSTVKKVWKIQMNLNQLKELKLDPD